ncbi:MAG: SDR family oxidoreductase [Desulfobacula sp.]|jgi:thioester reductase-like protein|nr:SDR family oxidoreductase [Desulfobacula sp.]
MKIYFITGSTGAIGASLVPLLLEEIDIELYLLIRADNKDHLAGRLEKLFQFWDFHEQDERKKRIKAVTGDIQQYHFGFEEELYHELSEKCTHLVHCAGNVRMNLSIETARACSVTSAENVIELAKICKQNKNLKKIEFVSTVGVGGRMQETVPEEWLIQKREFHNTYEQAKAEAEEFIKLYVDKGLPITVHRPSMVVSDSTTGKIIHYQIFYHLCEFLSGRRTLGVTPATGNTRLDIIPSDYVAKVIAWSSKTDKTIGAILHECSGPDNAILISHLKKKIQSIFSRYGVTLPKMVTIPVWLFKSLLPAIGMFVPEKSKRAMKALPVFFDYLTENHGFANEKTRDFIKEEIKPLEVDEYLENTLKCYLKNKNRTT